MLEADRLVIYAASEKEMSRIIEAENDAVLREAYGDMLRRSLEHEEDWGWHAIWMIVRKDGSHIGNLFFKGSPEDGVAELGCGIGEAYRGYGYATEALEVITAWALEQPGVTAIAAEAEPEDAAFQRVLEKCGFLPSQVPAGPKLRFVKETELEMEL